MPRPGNVSIFFGLGPRGDITENILRARLEEVAPVVDFRMKDRFAFADCAATDADTIVSRLNGMRFGSSTLTVQISKRDDPATSRRHNNDRNDRRRERSRGRRDHRRDRSRSRRRDRSRGRRDDSRDRRRRDDSRDRRRDDSRDRRRDDSRDRRRDDSRDRRRDDSRDHKRRRRDERRAEEGRRAEHENVNYNEAVHHHEDEDTHQDMSYNHHDQMHHAVPAPMEAITSSYANEERPRESDSVGPSDNYEGGRGVSPTSSN